MNEKKIVTFLNLDCKKKPDKFSMKLFTWFNLSWGGLVILCCFLFNLNQLIYSVWYDILFVVFSITTNIIFFVSIRYIKNNVYVWFHHLSVTLSSVFTLFYGWYVISKSEFIATSFPKFSHFLRSLGAKVEDWTC